MRMMGAKSLAYHEHAVPGRGDDPVANAVVCRALHRGGEQVPRPLTPLGLTVRV